MFWRAVLNFLIFDFRAGAWSQAEAQTSRSSEGCSQLFWLGGALARRRRNFLEECAIKVFTGALLVLGRPP